MFDFLVAGGGLFDCAAVDDADLFGAHAHADAGGVHGGVARSDDGGGFAEGDRGAVFGEAVGVHEVDSG